MEMWEPDRDCSHVHPFGIEACVCLHSEQSEIKIFQAWAKLNVGQGTSIANIYPKYILIRSQAECGRSYT